MGRDKLKIMRCWYMGSWI